MRRREPPLREVHNVEKNVKKKPYSISRSTKSISQITKKKILKISKILIQQKSFKKSWPKDKMKKTEKIQINSKMTKIWKFFWPNNQWISIFKRKKTTSVRRSH